MTITESGGLGYRDSDEFRIRPQPWRNTEESVPDISGGTSGAQGAQGAQGTQGSQGFAGEGGFVGDNGPVGADGITPGPDGDPGPQGNQGGKGPQGNQGAKDAIIYSSRGMVSVTCVEMPETLLMDVMDVENEKQIDPVFLSLVSDNSLHHIGIGASICHRDGKSFLVAKSPGSYIISGARRGFEGRRFVPQTKEQMEVSNRFWSRQTR